MSQNPDANLSAPTKVRFLVLAWLCVLAALAYVHRNCISVLETPMEHAFHLNSDDLGTAMATFFIGYAFFQIPCGWLGAKWGTRRALTFFVLLWSAALGSMGLVTGFTGLWIARLVLGIAQAGIFPCCVNTLSKWFPASEKAFPNGMLASFMSVGAVLAALLTSLLLYWLVWWQILLFYSLPGIVCALWFYYWFRDEPADHPSVNEKELAHIEQDQVTTNGGSASSDETERASTPWLTMVKNYRTWLICAQQIFRAAGLGYVYTWYPKFLQQVYGIEVKKSGFLSMAPLIAIIIGSALGGMLMDWVFRRTKSKRWSRQGVAAISTAMCGLLAIVAYFVGGAFLTTGMLALAIVCAGIGGPAGYTITIDMGGRHVTALFSTMNMMGNLGAAGIAKLAPKVAKWFGWEETLLLVAGFHLLASLSWALLNPEGTIFPERNTEREGEDPSAVGR